MRWPGWSAMALLVRCLDDVTGAHIAGSGEFARGGEIVDFGNGQLADAVRDLLNDAARRGISDVAARARYFEFVTDLYACLRANIDNERPVRCVSYEALQANGPHRYAARSGVEVLRDLRHSLRRRLTDDRAGEVAARHI